MSVKFFYSMKYSLYLFSFIYTVYRHLIIMIGYIVRYTLYSIQCVLYHSFTTVVDYAPRVRCSYFVGKANIQQFVLLVCPLFVVRSISSAATTLRTARVGFRLSGRHNFFFVPTLHINGRRHGPARRIIAPRTGRRTGIDTFLLTSR